MGETRVNPSLDDDGYESVESMDSEDEFDDNQYGTMARFVPTLVLERLRAVGEAAAVPKKSISGGVDTTVAADDAAEGINLPKAHELDAAVMVVDVSGFSGMCERFAQGFVPDGGWRQRMKGIPSLNVAAGRGGGARGGEGGRGCGVRRSGASHASMITSLYRLSNDKETKGFGAEGVRDALNLTLSALISTVERHGGDVLRIAGDALIVLFHQGGAGVSHFELADLCLACTRCGWHCAASVGAEAGGGGGGGGGGGLSVHVGVGCGRVSCFHVGSDRLGWQLVVSGGLFENQVAKALDASGAGEVVVSDQVWQHLAGTGWGSSMVEGDVRSSSPLGLRLLHWTPGPDPVGPGTGCWDDGFDSSSSSSAAAAGRGGEGRASIAPAHAGAGVLAGDGGGGSSSRSGASDSPPLAGGGRIAVSRRSSYSGGGKVGPAAAAVAAAAAAGAGGRGVPGSLQSNGRSVSLDHPASGAAGGSATAGGRWCPSRRRLSLLEEVETGVMTMLSKEVGRALRGYCPQSIREGLVAERLGLLAELQRVAVLFVGLSFEGVDSTVSKAPKTPQPTRTTGRIPKDSTLPAPGGESIDLPAGAGLEAAAAAAADDSSPMGKADDGPAVLSLELLQGSFSLLQSIVASHGGVIKELSVDDKGTVLVAGFGLSPQVGHLPAARATLCAMECTDRLRARGLARCHAGVATGPVFCGSLGSEDRREFAMISETVNLAQRLMSARKSRRLRPKTQAGKTNSSNTGSSTGTSPSPQKGSVRTSTDVNKTAVDGGYVSSPAATVAARRIPGNMSDSTLQKGEPQEVAAGFPLTPLATPTSQRKKLGGEGGAGEDLWQESFNRWVVLEAETLNEARKTDQLAFLELEAIKVKGKTSKVDVLAPSLADDVSAALAALPQPRTAVTNISGRLRDASHSGGSTNTTPDPVLGGMRGAPAPAPPGVILGGVGGRGGRIPPSPPLPRHRAIDPPAGGGSETVVRVGAVCGGTVLQNDCSLDDSKRYRLETPGRGKFWEEDVFSESSSVGGGGGGGSIIGEDPPPDAAAKRFASWQNLRSLPGGGRGGGATTADARGISPVGAAGNVGPRGGGGGGGGLGGERGGDVLSREAFEALLPCIFHADAVHDEVSHILWARTRGRVSYLADLCRSLTGTSRGAAAAAGSSSSGGTSFGEVGEDGTWRLRLNEFAHVLKLASRVPAGVEGALQRRLDELPYNARQVVLRVVCVTVVAGVGEIDLLLHLLTNVAPFKEYWKAVVSQHESGEAPTRRRSSRSRRRTSIPPRRSLTLSPVNTSPSVATTPATAAASTGAASVARAAIKRHDIARGGGGGGGSGGSGMAHAEAEAEPPAAAVATRPSPPRVQSMSEAAAAAMAEFLRDEAGAAGAEQDRKRTHSDVPGRPIARDSGGDTGLRTPPPVSPATARRAASPIDTSAGVGSGSGAGEEALRSCLAMLEAGGFLRLCEGGKTFVCDDMMLMDQVYASTPFKLRKSLHKEAAQWISDRHRRDFRDRADVMPMLINHLTQAHEEARAQAMLAVLKVLGGRFLDRWVLEHVRQLVTIRENPRNPTASEHLALCVLPALPSLRGLSKAIRGAEIAGVVVGVALRLRSLRFKDVDMMATPRHRRSLSVSGSSFKHDMDNDSPPRSNNRGTLVKRRSASLAGTAVAPSPSKLESLPPAASNSDGFEIVITDTSAVDGGDRSRDRGGPDSRLPLLSSSRTA